MKFNSTLIGKIVEVTFLDHMIKRRGDGVKAGAIECVVYGKITKVEPDAIHVSHWICVHDDKSFAEDNYETQVVLKKDIKHIEYLY